MVSSNPNSRKFLLQEKEVEKPMKKAPSLVHSIN